MKKVDGYLGQLFDLVDDRSDAQGAHGDHPVGRPRRFRNNHPDNTNPSDYTIPFFVWGARGRAGRPVRG